MKTFNKIISTLAVLFALSFGFTSCSMGDEDSSNGYAVVTNDSNSTAASTDNSHSIDNGVLIGMIEVDYDKSIYATCTDYCKDGEDGANAAYCVWLFTDGTFSETFTVATPDVYSQSIYYPNKPWSKGTWTEYEGKYYLVCEYKGSGTEFNPVWTSYTTTTVISPNNGIASWCIREPHNNCKFEKY